MAICTHCASWGAFEHFCKVYWKLLKVFWTSRKPLESLLNVFWPSSDRLHKVFSESPESLHRVFSLMNTREERPLEPYRPILEHTQVRTKVAYLPECVSSTLARRRKLNAAPTLNARSKCDRERLKWRIFGGSWKRRLGKQVAANRRILKMKNCAIHNNRSTVLFWFNAALLKWERPSSANRFHTVLRTAMLWQCYGTLLCCGTEYTHNIMDCIADCITARSCRIVWRAQSRAALTNLPACTNLQEGIGTSKLEGYGHYSHQLLQSIARRCLSNRLSIKMCRSSRPLQVAFTTSFRNQRIVRMRDSLEGVLNSQVEIDRLSHLNQMIWSLSVAVFIGQSMDEQTDFLWLTRRNLIAYWTLNIVQYTWTYWTWQMWFCRFWTRSKLDLSTGSDNVGVRHMFWL